MKDESDGAWLASCRTIRPPVGNPCVWLAVLLLIIATTATTSEAALTSSDVGTVAQWVKNRQFTNPAQSSYGAILVHHGAGYVDTGTGDLYYRVNPYFSHLAVWALLQSPTSDRLDVAERWIRWYLAHMDTGSAPGAVYDHWYKADGTGETTCPPNIPPAYCNFLDSEDAYAATFLGAVRQYMAAGGRRQFLDEVGFKTKGESIAQTVLALQQPDGLTWGKTNYQVKYVMDNSEVYWGLRSMAHLEEYVYGDTARALVYDIAADAVRTGIFSQLLSDTTGLFRLARMNDDSHVEADLDVWYGGTVQVAWPHLFGVVARDSSTTRAQMDALINHWDGAPKPDWTANFVDAGGFPWCSISFAAFLSGDTAASDRHDSLVKTRLFPTDTDPVGFPYPFSIGEAAWLLLPRNATTYDLVMRGPRGAVVVADTFTSMITATDSYLPTVYFSYPSPCTIVYGPSGRDTVTLRATLTPQAVTMGLGLGTPRPFANRRLPDTMATSAALASATDVVLLGLTARDFLVTDSAGAIVDSNAGYFSEPITLIFDIPDTYRGRRDLRPYYFRTADSTWVEALNDPTMLASGSNSFSLTDTQMTLRVLHFTSIGLSSSANSVLLSQSGPSCLIQRILPIRTAMITMRKIRDRALATRLGRMMVAWYYLL